MQEEVVVDVDVDVDVVEAEVKESEADAMIRIGKGFKHLNMFAQAAIDGTIRGLIAVGPPGIGKSHEVTQVLHQHTFIDELKGGRPTAEVIKGTISPGYLFRKLYEFKDSDQCLVLDDCEIDDDESLNLLKGALDSCNKREICWYKDARWLEAESIPMKFEYKGSIIFLTNIDFANARGKKAVHLGAIVSRCHYIDLEINSQRDYLLRIKQVVSGGMLDDRNISEFDQMQIVDYISDNAERMRELSLRMVVKIADLLVAFPNEWQEMASTTCMVAAHKVVAPMQFLSPQASSGTSKADQVRELIRINPTLELDALALLAVTELDMDKGRARVYVKNNLAKVRG